MASKGLLVITSFSLSYPSLIPFQPHTCFIFCALAISLPGTLPYPDNCLYGSLMSFHFFLQIPLLYLSLLWLLNLKWHFPTLPRISKIRQGCPISPFQFQVELDILNREIRQENKIKGIHIRKGKLSLFVGDMILLLKNLNNSQKIFRSYKMSSILHLYTNNEWFKSKLEKQFHLL